MKTLYTQITGDFLQQLLKKIPDVDALVERCEIVLDMFPNNLKINIVLMGTAKDVQDFYEQKYKRSCDYVAFISLDSSTIHLSVSDVTKKVLGHEIGHAIVEAYFTERPPYNIHELIAQYCEKHI